MGRPKLIETPDQLDQYFREYSEWVLKNPYLMHDFKGKDATEVWLKKQRPLSWSGFEAWLCREGIVSHLGHYEQNKDGNYEDYLPIIRVIKKQCSGDIIDGSLAGIYNANIAARVEGLKDVSDVNVNDSRKATADLFPLDETDSKSES